MYIEPIGVHIEADRKSLPIFVATTESERPLPHTFRRFFIEAHVSRPTLEILVEVGRTRFLDADQHLELLRAAAALFANEDWPLYLYLDFIHAAMQMSAQPNSPEWDRLIRTMITPKLSASGGSQKFEATGNGVLRAFLCHSSIDKARIRDLSSRLREYGFDTWLDEDAILAGQNWDGEISKAVRSTDVVIVCLSRKGISRRGYFEKEMHAAMEIAHQKPDGFGFIIPIRLDDCPLPQELTKWQGADLYAKGGIEKLIKALIWLAVTLNKVGR